MANAYFVAGAEPGRYEPTDHVRGPWSPDAMHGGPPSALLAHVMSAVEGLPAPGMMTRFTAEILRPVQVAPVRARARCVRGGRRVALVEAALWSDASDEPAMLARAWLLRTADVPVPETPVEAAPDRPGDPAVIPPHWGRGYLDSVEWRAVSGSFEQPGPSTMWTRPRTPLLEGHELAGMERVLVVADSGSGISAVASPRELIFVNTDLTVHLRRPPRGGNVWLRSETTLDGAGIGLASTVLGDEQGAIGVAAQSLFVGPAPSSRA